MAVAAPKASNPKPQALGPELQTVSGRGPPTPKLTASPASPPGTAADPQDLVGV